MLRAINLKYREEPNVTAILIIDFRISHLIYHE